MRAPKAEKLYREFHQNDPKRISQSSSFRIPSCVGLAGRALEVLYRSDKRDPETGKQPRSPIDYIHEHDEGVLAYRTDLRGKSVSVPKFISEVKELVLLGQCLGFAYEDEEGQEIEARVTQPYPELYAIPSGRALLVVQGKRSVLAMIWGGRLGVEARGIVH